MEFEKHCRNLACELDDTEISYLRHVVANKYTMTSLERLINTIKACRYVVENEIPGDFVECGVWRGGHGILAKLMFQRLDPNRSVWMFDTFAGMTAPDELDVSVKSDVNSHEIFKKSQRETHNEWCYASLEEVKHNCVNSNLKLDQIKFVQGDVTETLKFKKNLPGAISILRLDTDFYDSTKIELEVLYPLVEKGGVITIDDYGYWRGSKLAVDQYFSRGNYKPLFNIIDSSGRSAIKL